MEGIRGNVSDQSFKCTICQGGDGGTTNEFAGRLQVKTSCPNGCQLHLGCVPRQTDQQLKLDQRRCTTCQTLPVLPLLCESESVQKYACRSGNCQALAQIIQINFDRGFNIQLDTELLFTAVREGNSKCLELLFNAGAKANATLNDGSTLLHRAAFYGDIKSLEVLLKTPGVKIDVTDKNGSTALHCAAKIDAPGHTDCLKMLIATRRVDITKKDSAGLTPLHCAAMMGNTENLKLLLSTPGIDINVTCNQGLTPLHYATSRDKFCCLEELLSRGANVNAIVTHNDSDVGVTPLDLVKSKSNSKCKEHLIAKGAKTSLELKRLEGKARKQQVCRLM